MVKSRDFNCEGIKRDEKTFDTKADGSIFTSAKEKPPIPEAEPPVFTQSVEFVDETPKQSREKDERRTNLKNRQDAKRKNLAYDPDPVTLISKLDISDPLHLHLNDTTALTVVSIKLKRTKNYQVWSYAMLLALEGKIRLVLLMEHVKGLIQMRFQYDAMIELPKCVCNASESFKKHNQLLKLMQFLMGLDDSYMQIRSFILSREVLLDVRSAYATISSEESHRVAAGIVGSSQRNQASAV
ncbi:ribonuclease H-like domain-containing protein [Tanacetum coccineum]